MITIPSTQFSSRQKLSDILYIHKKDYLLKMANRLDFWISPNVTKDKVASRLADAMLSEPIEIVSRLSRTELLLLDEFIQAGPDKYIVKKMRKTFYMLQKWGLVVTYEDVAKNQWHMIMPDEVRESLSTVASPYISLAREGKKGPSAKDLRMTAMLNSLLGFNSPTD